MTEDRQEEPSGSPPARVGAKRLWRPPALDGLVPVPTFRDRPATPASDIEGVDLRGQRVQVAVAGSGHWTLLVFLSAACDGCIAIWDALVDPAASGLATDEAVVAVTRDAGVDDPAKLRALAPATARVVQSSAGWDAYRVQGPPFFALVDGRAGAGATVTTEGVAWAVEQIAADVARARGQA